MAKWILHATGETQEESTQENQSGAKKSTMHTVWNASRFTQAAWTAAKDTAGSDAGSEWYEKVRARNRHLIPLHAISH